MWSIKDDSLFRIYDLVELQEFCYSIKKMKIITIDSRDLSVSNKE